MRTALARKHRIGKVRLLEGSHDWQSPAEALRFLHLP
jgi:hypothetical protein